MMIHKLEDEEYGKFLPQNVLLNDGFSSLNREFKVTTIIELVNVGNFQNRVQESEEQVKMLQFDKPWKNYFELFLIRDQVVGRPGEKGWDVLNVRAHDWHIFLNPVV